MIRMKKLLACCIAAALCLTAAFALAGCGANGQSAEDAATQNRAYLAQANTAAMKLIEDLGPFNEAVAKGDIVTMESAADAACRDLDAFREISAPDAMKEIHVEYSAGCDDLKQALRDYVALYRDRDAKGMTNEEFNKRIAEIQEVYNRGIAHLQAGDDKAKALPGATPSSSSSDDAGVAGVVVAQGSSSSGASESSSAATESSSQASSASESSSSAESEPAMQAPAEEPAPVEEPAPAEEQPAEEPAPVEEQPAEEPAPVQEGEVEEQPAEEAPAEAPAEESRSNNGE